MTTKSEAGAETRHTPGPWEIGDRTPGSVNERFVYYGQTAVAVVCTGLGVEACDVNARLISAAPEMLEALEQTETWFTAISSATDTAAILSRIRETIQKARAHAD